MYSRNQTLRHKVTNRLARLDESAQDKVSLWAWNIGERTAFVDEDGSQFTDDINNYTHIEDEFGRPYSNPPQTGEFVDESARKYLVDDRTKAKMRRESLLKWERKILDRMEGKNLHQCDRPKKSVLCPFADGSHCSLIEKFFLFRRGAKPLYRQFDSVTRKWKGHAPAFTYKGQLWMYDRHLSDLVVIKLQ